MNRDKRPPASDRRADGTLSANEKHVVSWGVEQQIDKRSLYRDILFIEIPQGMLFSCWNGSMVPIRTRSALSP